MAQSMGLGPLSCQQHLLLFLAVCPSIPQAPSLPESRSLCSSLCQRRGNETSLCWQLGKDPQEGTRVRLTWASHRAGRRGHREIWTALAKSTGLRFVGKGFSKTRGHTWQTGVCAWQVTNSHSMLNFPSHWKKELVWKMVINRSAGNWSLQLWSSAQCQHAVPG